jgi:hypothetical protein
MKAYYRDAGVSYETSPVLTSVGATSRRDIRLRSRLEAALARRKLEKVQTLNTQLTATAIN